MARDEYGFDPDEDYTIKDNPFWDGTDAAHPSWWRGQEDGVKGAAKAILQIIEENKDHDVGDSWRTVDFIEEVCKRWLGMRH